MWEVLVRTAICLLLTGVIAAACAHGAGTQDADSPRPTSPQPTVTRPAAPGTSTGSKALDKRRDPLKPVGVDRSPFGDKFFHRAPDGTTLVLMGSIGLHPRLWTRYRVYGPRWKPRTPLLQVPALLEIAGHTSHGFLGRVEVLDSFGNTRFRKLVLIGDDGLFRVVPVAHQTSPIRPEDEVIISLSARRMWAYRPSTGYVVKLRPSRDQPPFFSLSDAVADTGEACILDIRDDDTEVYWTFDSGHTWHRQMSPELLKSDLEPHQCSAVASDRLVMVSSGYQRGLARVSTIAPGDRTTLNTYRLDKRFAGLDEGFSSLVLPSGRIAFLPLRHGLMVATNRSNSGFEFRPAPIDQRKGIQVVGRELVIENGGRRRNLLDISSDAGRTWHTMDLQAGDWTSGG